MYRSLCVYILLDLFHFMSTGIYFMPVWRGGVGPATNRSAGSSPGRCASRNDPGQVVRTHVLLFTKQYKLVPAKER